MKKLLIIAGIALLLFGFKADNSKVYKVQVKAEDAKIISTILDSATELISKSDAPTREADKVRQELQSVKKFLEAQYAKQDSTK